VSDTRKSSLSGNTLVFGGAALLCAWTLSAFFSAQNMSRFEVVHAVIILALFILVRVFAGNAQSLSKSPSGRLWTMGLFTAAAVLISPFFLHAISIKPLAELDTLTWAAGIAPLACIVLFAAIHKAFAGSIPPVPSAGFEAMLLRSGVRFQLALVTLFILGAGLALSTTPIKMLLPRFVVIACLLLAFPALRDLCSLPGGTRAMQLISGASLIVCAVFGVLRNGELQRKVEEANLLLKDNQPDNAAKAYAAAASLNRALLVKSAGEEIALNRSRWHEERAEYDSALFYLRELAGQRGIDPTELVAVHRIYCKQGESENSWKRMVLQGFPAISDPELVPGIYALGDNPKSGLRPRLLAALLAFELGEPKVELIRRLEAVQTVAPTEPSSRSLLNRLGVKTEGGPMRLPNELLVARKRFHVFDGVMDDVGAAETIAVLDKGTWELGVVARATPLHEEWPIIRLELNGQVVTRSQVTKTEFHEVPFTFVVNRTNLYSVRIVMENQREEVDEGHIMRRGLTIDGLNMRHAP